jgi:hypothetical protein
MRGGGIAGLIADSDSREGKDLNTDQKDWIVCVIVSVIMICSTGCQLPTSTNPPRRDPATITEAEAIAVLQ